MYLIGSGPSPSKINVLYLINIRYTVPAGLININLTNICDEMQTMPNSKKNITDSYSVQSVFQKFLKSGVNSFEDYYENFTHKKGDVFNLSRMNQKGFYFILSGLIKLEMVSPTPRIIRLCKTGDLVGYGNWLTDSTTKYRLVALQDCVVQFWSHKGFEEARLASPELSDLVIRHLVQVVLHKDERLASLENSSVEERVKSLLKWMGRNFGTKSDEGILIDIHLDRESMAQLAGTVSETFSRVLTLLEHDGIISRKGRQIVITDLDGLNEKI